MKTAKDPRHLERIKTMQELFAWNFNMEELPEEDPAKQIVEHKDVIDNFISHAAPEWPLDKINKIDLAILRLATFELTISKAAPPKVIVDEAVELAKEYGGQSSPAFVNGALGKLIEDQKII